MGGIVSWLKKHWQAVTIGVLATNNLVAITSTTKDDAIWTALKAVGKSKGKAAVLPFPFFLALLLSGCAITETGAYTPPDPCECVAVEDGTCAYDSLILSVIPDPSGVALALKLANTASVGADLYGAAEALDAVEDIRAFVIAAGSWSDLVAYVVARIDASNAAAVTAILLTSEYLGAFDVPVALTPCDQALLLKHLDDQAAILLTLAAGGK